MAAVRYSPLDVLGIPPGTLNFMDRCKSSTAEPVAMNRDHLEFQAKLPTR
jgi:hypothetical protein